jgi:DNA polymerase-4
MQYHDSLFILRFYKLKILHIKIINFQATVTTQEDRSLLAKAVVIGSLGDKGIVMSCNAVATAYGIEGGQSIPEAKRWCQSIVFKQSDVDKCKEAHARIKNLLSTYTEQVETLSLGEYYIDVEHNQDAQYSILWLADKIQKAIFKNEQLNVAIGVGQNKLLASIALGWAIPSGLFILSEMQRDEVMKDLPISRIPALGKATQQRFHDMDVSTCGDLQKVSKEKLMQMCGASYGKKLHNYAFGRDERKIKREDQKKYLAVTHKFPLGLQLLDECNFYLDELVKSLDLKIKGIRQPIKAQFITIKYDDGKRKSEEMKSAVNDLGRFKKIMRSLFESAKGRHIKSIGVGVKLTEEAKKEAFQVSFIF